MTVMSEPNREQPRCPRCGYILLGLTEFRCPECGSPFDPMLVENPALRSHLLPWERPELGGRVGRFFRTLSQAWTQPGFLFIDLNARKDHAVGNASLLIVLCVVLSICVHVVMPILERIAFFLRLLWERGHAWSAYDTVIKTLQVTASTFWVLPAVQVFSMALAVFVAAFFLTRVSRGRVGILRTMDVAAVFSPTVLLGALIWGMMAVIDASLKHQFPAPFTVVAICAQPVILLSFVWFCCRRLLSLNRRGAVGVVCVCGALLYLCGVAGMFLLVRLSMLILPPQYG